MTAGGKSATFTLVGEAILRGAGACLPSASQCQAIDLKPGQTEELEYLPPTAAPTVTYELRVVSITAASQGLRRRPAASRASAGRSRRPAWQLLRRRGPDGAAGPALLRAAAACSCSPAATAAGAPRAHAARAWAAPLD